MKIEDLITQLRAEKWPSRKLDVDLAALFGFRRATEARHPKFSWHHPDGNVGPLPKFTYSMQDAYDLLQTVSPRNVAACTWEEGKATAKVENGPLCACATPAMAICVVALVELRKKMIKS